MQDLKNYSKRSSDEFPEPSPVLAAYFGGLITGGGVAIIVAIMFMGATA